MVSHTALLRQGIHFMPKEVWQWARAHGLHWSLCPQHPGAAGLREWWSGLLKTRLQLYLGGNTRRAESSSPEGHTHSESTSNTGAVGLMPEFAGPGATGREQECHRVLTHSDPPAEVFSPYPVTLCSAGLDVSVPEGGTLPLEDRFL